MASVKKRLWTHKGVQKEAWTVRYKDHSGAHRQRTFERKKDADKYRQQVMNELDEGVHIPKSQHQTFAFAYEAFKEEMRLQVAAREIKNTTMRGRIYALDKYALPEFREKAIQAITEEDMVSWFRQLVAGGIEPSSAANRVQMVGQIFEFAIQAPRKWLKTNVAYLARKEIRTRRRRVKSFEPDQVRELLRLVKEKPGRMRQRSQAVLECFVNLGAFCGMRFGEIAGLKRDLVDFDTGRIQVRFSLDTLKQLTAPKTDAGNRDIFAPRHVIELLRAYTDAYPSSDPDGLIFQTPGKAADGTGLKVRPGSKAARLEIRQHNIEHASRVDNSHFQQHLWKKLLLRAGHKPIEQPMPGGGVKRTWRHFHELRHFAASWMIDSKWTIPEVSNQLGHSNPAVTLRVYSHMLKTTDQTARASQALAHRLFEQGAQQIPSAQEVHTAHSSIH